jgi:hypothetical protein
MGNPFKRTGTWLVLAAIVNCMLQWAWFSPKCSHDIDFDGIDYIGIARHINNGNFLASINAFRSPLISWIIAAFSPLGGNFLLIGKLVSITGFILSLILTYFLTDRLWHSQLAAGLAVLWLSLGRGLIPTSVQFVSPDFLLTALVIAYFLRLLSCLRVNRPTDWFYLGGIHGVAYLAKAIAMPWLAVSTASAVLLCSGQTWKGKLLRFAAAGLIPLVVAGMWGSALHSKYDVFTLGSQFKTNLLQWTLHEKLNQPGPQYSILGNGPGVLDKYMVNDPMPPASYPWHYQLRYWTLAPKFLHAELQNVPRALKEIAIVVTPGGMLAFFLGLGAIFRRCSMYPLEFRFALVVLISAASLILAYCMLVFDGRYIFPLLPLLIAIASGFMVNTSESGLTLSTGWRQLCLTLVVLGLLFSTLYWASPFRALNRDFQFSCFDAARKLQLDPGSKIVSIGAGPFPEHGVGWEAGYKTAFFSGRRLIAASDTLPDPSKLALLLADLRKADPDMVMVWGRSYDARYGALCAALVKQSAAARPVAIEDRMAGEVGSIFFLR